MSGCDYPLSNDSSVQIQINNISRNMHVMYANESSIPDGDLTKIAIEHGVFVSTDNLDDVAAMSRLKIDLNRSVMNEFGGDVRLLSDNGSIELVYTKVPDETCSALEISRAQLNLKHGEVVFRCESE